MTEQKVKKRGWVKNAAIIFLAVMLVLTFFSNTIMNRSLPEVATQYVQSGTITAKIRGTGTVTATESYEVKSEQTRKILSVPVKVGDKVEVGTTLLNFADAESKDILEAQRALDELILAYQLKLVDASNGMYDKENRAVKSAQTALDRAKADRDANYVTDAEIKKAREYVDSCEIAVKAQEDAITKLEGEVGTGTTDLAKAEANLKSQMLVHGNLYKTLVQGADEWMHRDGLTTGEQKAANRETYLAALVEKYKNILANPGELDSYTIEHYTNLVDAYKAIKPAQDAVEAAKKGSGLSEAKQKLVVLNRNKNNADEALKKLNEKKDALKSSESDVTAKQTALDTAIEALETARKADAKEDIQFAADKKKIEEQRKVVDNLKAGGTGASVTSPVNGIIKTINATAGNVSEPATALMTIEVPDRGYGVNISVTTEQSKKVKVGDVGEVTNNYWGSDLTATLVGIKTDTQNPNTNKLLCFKIIGEVESGSQLGISIGERGANYEAIVPNSAIRSDNNGEFVLAVTAKSSALGNRYVAQRVDVKVLAKDDVNSAVSGGLTNSDFVITTSTKPIEPGMQVRLPD